MKKKNKFLLIVLILLIVIVVSLITVSKNSEMEWRLEILSLKSKNELTDLSWNELIKWIKPGSPVYLKGIEKTKNPYSSIKNLFTSESDIKDGERIYRSECAVCHGGNGEGVSGPSFRSFNHGGSDWALFRNITRGISGTAMQAHHLTEIETWRVVSYVRSLNRKMNAHNTDVGDAANVLLKPAKVPYQRIKQAVEDPANWLTYSGQYNGRRYSKLNEINNTTVWRLRTEWALQLDTQESVVETSPVIADGIMYITQPPNIVIALDASSGHQLWMYKHNLPDQLTLCCGKVNRGVAVLDDKVYLATLDAHLIALDSRNGHIIWDKAVADPRNSYSITGAPIALKDMVVIGIAGGEFGTRGFVTAYDASSGEQRWRFYTIPEPGAPGSETWSGDSWKTGGAPTWHIGSFDPELNLIYWGVGNPGPDFIADDRQGDNLYSNSVIALNADSGKLKWHFQFTPQDDHDWDSVQIPVLVDRDVNGVPRKLLLWANRNGFYYVLDRVTGEFLSARNFVKQTWAEKIDSNGRPIKRKDASPSVKGSLVWPGVTGGTNWWPPSYSPKTGLIYIPILEASSIFFRTETLEFTQGEFFLGSAGQKPPDQQHFTGVRALDAVSGELRWEHRFPERGGWSKVGGVLSTAGDIVFVGDYRTFYAFDASSGKLLWEFETGGTINAPPVTYQIDGKQLVSLATGRAIFTFGLTPDKKPRSLQ